MILAQRTGTHCKWGAVPKNLSRPSRSARKTTVVAKDGMEFQIAGQGNDMAPGLAAAFFLAAKQGVVAATVENMRTVLAGAVLVIAAANILVRRELNHWDISALAPASLAAETLNVLPLGPAAIGAFGTILCKALESVLNVRGSYYFLLASLAACVYYDVGALWVSAALLITYGSEFVKGANNNRIMFAPAAISAVSAYALIDYARDKCLTCANEIAVAIVIGRCAWAAFNVGKALFESETD